jgi:succinate-acetate transporter protein
MKRSLLLMWLLWLLIHILFVHLAEYGMMDRSSLTFGFYIGVLFGMVCIFLAIRENPDIRNHWLIMELERLRNKLIARKG